MDYSSIGIALALNPQIEALAFLKVCLSASKLDSLIRGACPERSVRVGVGLSSVGYSQRANLSEHTSSDVCGDLSRTRSGISIQSEPQANIGMGTAEHLCE